MGQVHDVVRVMQDILTRGEAEQKEEGKEGEKREEVKEQTEKEEKHEEVKDEKERVEEALSDEDRQAFVARLREEPWNAVALLYKSTPAVQADRRCVLAAVQSNGRALEFASNDMKQDKEVVRAAV